MSIAHDQHINCKLTCWTKWNNNVVIIRSHNHLWLFNCFSYLNKIVVDHSQYLNTNLTINFLKKYTTDKSNTCDSLIKILKRCNPIYTSIQKTTNQVMKKYKISVYSSKEGFDNIENFDDISSNNNNMFIFVILIIIVFMLLRKKF